MSSSENNKMNCDLNRVNYSEIYEKKKSSSTMYCKSIVRTNYYATKLVYCSGMTFIVVSWELQMDFYFRLVSKIIRFIFFSLPLSLSLYPANKTYRRYICVVVCGLSEKTK